MRPLRRTAVTLVVASVALLACQAILGIDDDRFSFTPDDAASDAGTDAPAPRCALAVPPPAPVSPDGTNLFARLIFALKEARFVEEGGSSIGGYDLDNACTCDALDVHGGDASCVGAMNEGVSLCDDDAGVDNVTSGILQRLLATVRFLNDGGADDQDFSRQARCGVETILVVLQNYNGQANDPEVRAKLLPSFGVREGTDAGEPPREDCPDHDPQGLPLRPKWDGTDRWSLRPGDDPATEMATAWVKDFQLVVDSRNQTEGVTVVLGSEVLVLHTPVATGRLVPLDADGGDLPIVDGGVQGGPPARFRLENMILTGRAKADDILRTIGHFKINGGDPDPKNYLCNIPAVFPIVQTEVCRSRDIISPPGQDFQQLPCNALSVGLKFTAHTANIGEARHQPTVTACDAGFQPTCE